MTKKQFIELADLIKDNPTVFNAVAIDMLAWFCNEHSPNFNRERWMGYIRGTNSPNGGG